MAASPDVLVIGGGIIGLTAAYELAVAGLSVEVHDKSGVGTEASWAGAGIIPPGNPARAATPLDQLRAFGAEHFPGFTNALRELTRIGSGYRRNGAVEFLDDPDDAVRELWDREGIEYELLDPASLKKRFPVVGAVREPACYLPGMAQVRNPRLLRALHGACEKKGVRFVYCRTIEGFRISNSRIQAVRLQQYVERTAGLYLIAAGAWADPLLKELNCTLRIHPVRGQIVLYRAAPKFLGPSLIRGKRYLVPRHEGRILVGSTEDAAAGFDKSTTADGVAGLQRFAEELVPGLKDVRIEKTWAGLRPGSRDGMPSIGFVPGFDNALAAVGHFRSGIQLSLGTARMLRELILKEPFTIDPTQFRLDRPPTPLGKLAFRS